ncbi:MAG: biotin transporter BioY [Hyphomicrobiales bacterium]
MTNMVMSERTLAGKLWSGDSVHGLLRATLLVILGAMMLTLSAKIKVPFWPVEMTLQTFVIMALAASYGWRLGLVTVMAYMAEGALGLPVFTGTPEKGIGLAYMVGPTGGYLLGFIAATVIVGWFAEQGWARSPLKLGAVMLLADAVLFGLGLLWLGNLLGWDKPILEWGLYPFVLGDVVKIALAATTVSAVTSLVERRKA